MTANDPSTQYYLSGFLPCPYNSVGSMFPNGSIGTNFPSQPTQVNHSSNSVVSVYPHRRYEVQLVQACIQETRQRALRENLCYKYTQRFDERVHPRKGQHCTHSAVCHVCGQRGHTLYDCLQWLHRTPVSTMKPKDGKVPEVLSRPEHQSGTEFGSYTLSMYSGSCRYTSGELQPVQKCQV